MLKMLNIKNMIWIESCKLNAMQFDEILSGQINKILKCSGDIPFQVK